MRRAALALLAILGGIGWSSSAFAQPRTEYRAFWVDTFNTALNTHDDILAIVANAKAAHANAIVAQVRRRGDAWYLDSLEPLPDFMPIPPGYDPLRDLITTAHASGLEVHAFCIVGAIWNKDPMLEPSTEGGAPSNPQHVFNRHGGFDPQTGKIVHGPDTWLTRTLLPDNAKNKVSYQGHRFGKEFWIDLGHPDAAEYTLNVLMHLVRNYDIDGLHLDRIRYPEVNAGGQGPTLGANVGYNATSIERFQRRYGIRRGSKPPAPNDPRWSQWRRDQVTNFVRRLYLEIMAVKPQLKVSAALIAYGGGPRSETEWSSAEAYWRVFQDWRAWMEEGIIDIAMPMVYKSDHNSGKRQFDQWNSWLRTHRYDRAGVIGIGGFVNSFEGTIRQAQRALEPSSQGAKNDGVIFFSMASLESGKELERSFDQFASGLTNAVFDAPAQVPTLEWKVSPTRGHLADFARRPDGAPVDAGEVTITRVGSKEPTLKTVTDARGFFGAVDLDPGDYRVQVTLGDQKFHECIVNVTPGTVAPRPEMVLPQNIVVGTDRESCSASVNAGLARPKHACPNLTLAGTRSDGQPMDARYGKGTTHVSWTATTLQGQTSTATQSVTVRDFEAPLIRAVRVDADTLWPANRRMRTVHLHYIATDNCSDVKIAVSVSSSETTGRSTDWEIISDREVRLRAERDPAGSGRIYTITITATDADGNTSVATATVIVPAEGPH